MPLVMLYLVAAMTKVKTKYRGYMAPVVRTALIENSFVITLIRKCIDYIFIINLLYLLLKII